MSCGSCGCGRCAGCKFFTAVVALLATLTTIATAIGVYVTHITPEGWMFGTPNGSLAVIAFLVSIMCWLKLVKKLCPCNKGMCKDGGMCPMCHHNPCTCK